MIFLLTQTINTLPTKIIIFVQALNGKPMPNWEKYTILLNDPSTNFSLLEGSNTIAIETHQAWWSFATIFDLRVQATRL